MGREEGEGDNLEEKDIAYSALSNWSAAIV